MSDHNTRTGQDGAAESTSTSMLGKAKTGETETWRRLVDQYAPLLYDWCRQRGLKAEDAAEIAFLQEYAEKEATRLNHSGSLSLGDACCLAVGKRLRAVVVASDGFWDLLTIEGVDIFQLR